MTPHQTDDLLLRSLSRLPPIRPNPGRAERVTARCRAAVRVQARAADRRARARRLIEPVAVSAFTVVYFIALVRDVLRTYRWL